MEQLHDIGHRTLVLAKMLTKERERFSSTFLFSPTSTYITERERERERKKERVREIPETCGDSKGSSDAYVTFV